ncbi:pentatricopeptide repeat-containing protein At2g13600-like [Cryptomeria japonica]|uniref:pentatricopeptide repeat-containing protein At2g13600-like n=1 Tax=Cryptomeria japonica TaxID=3369 RepID=UPI0027D9F9D3|nr:pentatricopeptide repeat-containing protein At2g13600-like [Cryptomeria japonica]
MNVKCGSIHKAYELFDKMTQRSVVSWTAMIVAYEQNSLLENSLEIFKKMQLADVELNSSTFSSILPTCAKMGALDEGMEIHRKVFEDEFSSDVIVLTALIDMYAKCGNLQKAHELFDGIPQQDVVSWTAIVTRYAQNGFVDKALEIFKHMQFSGVKPKFNNFYQCSSTPVLRFRVGCERPSSNDLVAITLADMNAKCGRT